MTNLFDRRFTMPFGKYRGQDLEDIPPSYLEWLLRETDFYDTHRDLAEEAERQIQAKGGEGIVRKGGGWR